MKRSYLGDSATGEPARRELAGTSVGGQSLRVAGIPWSDSSLDRGFPAASFYPIFLCGLGANNRSRKRNNQFRRVVIEFVKFAFSLPLVAEDRNSARDHTEGPNLVRKFDRLKSRPLRIKIGRFCNSFVLNGLQIETIAGTQLASQDWKRSHTGFRSSITINPFFLTMKIKVRLARWL
jgi:hypothetical protein